MLLSDEEMTELVTANLEAGGGYHQLGHAVQAAVLAKLASAELPEPAIRDGEWFEENSRAATDFYTADQLRQAYAQGAVAQLADKPSAWQWTVNKRIKYVHPYCPTSGDYDEGTLIELYTRKEASK